LRCGGQQRFRDGEAEGLGGLEIDGMLDFCGQFDRQIGWFRALENTSDIDASALGATVRAGQSRQSSRKGPWDNLTDIVP
jgi:hypothetical protein